VELGLGTVWKISQQILLPFLLGQLYRLPPRNLGACWGGKPARTHAPHSPFAGAGDGPDGGLRTANGNAAGGHGMPALERFPSGNAADLFGIE
jgi:hypothetical protein